MAHGLPGITSSLARSPLTSTCSSSAPLSPMTWTKSQQRPQRIGDDLTTGGIWMRRIHEQGLAVVRLEVQRQVDDRHMERVRQTPERDLMARELGTRINSALSALTPRERMVFELKHYQGLKLRTVGEILNTTEETAKNTLFRATQKLRGALADMR